MLNLVVIYSNFTDYFISITFESFRMPIGCSSVCSLVVLTPCTSFPFPSLFLCSVLPVTSRNLPKNLVNAVK